VGKCEASTAVLCNRCSVSSGMVNGYVKFEFNDIMRYIIVFEKRFWAETICQPILLFILFETYFYIVVNVIYFTNSNTRAGMLNSFLSKTLNMKMSWLNKNKII